MLIPRLRTIPILENSLIRSTSAAAHVALFHSTPTSCEKWNNKWKFDVESGKEPSKSYIKYVTRQKRSDAKKALKDLLYNNGSFSQSQNSGSRWSPEQGFDLSGSLDKKGRLKSSNRRHTGKSQQKRTKRKNKRQSLGEEFEGDGGERMFHASFGERSYTWSFRSWKESSSSCENPTSGFDWREHLNMNNRRFSEEGQNSSDCGGGGESDEEEEEEEMMMGGGSVVGSSFDRSLLGLPQTGRLKMEDVKTAFRLSALKWHPDKHQGSSQSQAIAEEKFKLCVNAYKSLCCALSSS